LTEGKQAHPVDELPNKVADGRFIAYSADVVKKKDWKFDCTACGRTEICDKTYYYTDDDDKPHRLCYHCVRGEPGCDCGQCTPADPRYIWWSDATPC
jgi:hypothetical protein